MPYLHTTAVPRTAHDVAYSVLRGAILGGRLQPGTRLVQDETARALGVSVTPVREALRELHTRGLVRLQPHTGAAVERVTLDGLIEVFELRALLEPMVFRSAAAVISPPASQRLRALAAEITATALDDVARSDVLDAVHAQLLATASPVVANGLRRLLDVSLLGTLAVPDDVRDALRAADATLGLLVGAVARGQEHRAADVATRRIRRQLGVLTAWRDALAPAGPLRALAS